MPGIPPPDGGSLDRSQVAAALREIAALVSLKDETPFRRRAYEKAASSLDALERNFDELVGAGRLTDIPGIGDGLAALIAELAREGRSPTLDGLRAELPPGSAELARLPDLGLARITALHAALGIDGLESLRAACESGRVRSLRGFGEKAEARLLAAIRALDSGGKPLLLARALEEESRLLTFLRGSEAVLAAEPAGPLRRREEIVDRLDFVVESDSPAAALDRFVASSAGSVVLHRDASRATVKLPPDVVAHVDVAPAGGLGWLLLEKTGTIQHLAALQRHAASARRPGPSHAGGSSTGPDAPLYAAMGLPFIPPELRQDGGEVEAAARGLLPEDLVETAHVRGFVHCHTVHSDGTGTIEEMAREAEARGMGYITITDHSPAAHYAHGLTVDRLERQWAEIDRVQAGVGVRILRGAECDILADGTLDYPDHVLARLDVVIASIHDRHGMDRAQMTRRLVKAMSHPRFKIWGHALGRLLKRRPPIDCDVERVLDALAASRGAVEINGDPNRLDLEPRWIKAAAARGLRFVISTDAHSTSELSYLEYGVLMARRGGVSAREVLNSRDADDFAAAVSPR